VPLFEQLLQMRLPFFVVLLRVIAELHTMRCYLDALVDLQQHDPHQPRADQHTSRPDWELTHLRQLTRGDPPVRGAASFYFLSGVFL
jgi:hypothetical protein